MIEIISNWFFVWFLLFIIGIIKENPLWFLIIGYIITFIQIFYLIYRKINNYNLIKFAIINFILKIIPIIIILVKTSFNFKINSLT